MMEPQKYGKIEILVIIGEIATTKLEFLDSTLTLQGNFLIVTTEKINLKTNETEEFNITATSRIWNLDELAGYKTYNNNTK